MARHVVIGNGKLGSALISQMNQKGDEAFLITRSKGHEYPGSRFIEEILLIKPDYVWCCVGAGSVEDAKRNFERSVMLHECLPVELATRLPKSIGLVFFSTDYVADEENPNDPNLTTERPRSLYALTKLQMERTLKLVGRERCLIFRVGSLYTKEPNYRKDSLPGRLIENYTGKTQASLPLNLVTPTPVPWLADLLLTHAPGIFHSGTSVHHAAPLSNVSVLELGHKILGPSIDCASSGFDLERPLVSRLECSFASAPSWSEIWDFF